MSENNKEKLVEQEVARQLSEVSGKQVNIAQMEAMLASKFEFLYKQLYKEGQELSAKQLLRAVFNAINLGVDSGLEPKMHSQDEAKFAGYFAQLLDLRNVKLATEMQKEQQTNTEGETNVSTN